VNIYIYIYIYILHAVRDPADVKILDVLHIPSSLGSLLSAVRREILDVFYRPVSLGSPSVGCKA
jgi:hypothetical protein